MVFGTIDQWSLKKSAKVRKSVNKAYIHNIGAAILCFPITFALHQAKLIPAIRTALLLLVFSQANDLMIEFWRKDYMSRNYTTEELKQMAVQDRVNKLKVTLDEVMQDEKVSI